MATDMPPQHTSTGDGNGGIAILFAGILAGVILTSLAMVFLVESMSWDWKTLTGSKSPNLIEAWRNIGLIALGIVGVGLATWRSILAHQQNQNAIAQRRISERGMNVDRYQKGAQMLESDELSVRIAGIYGLRELAISDPEESYIIVQSLLFAFIREKSRERVLEKPTSANAGFALANALTTDDGLSPDIHEALNATTALRKAVENAHHLEEKARWHANLVGANLSDADLPSANLSGANLERANLFNVCFREANLTMARLMDANLSKADLDFIKLPLAILERANLSKAFLKAADLTGANLSGANLSDAELYDANLSETHLFRANLTGADLSGASLINAKLIYVNLTDADLGQVSVGKERDFRGIWAWADRPPRNMPPEIEAAITYRDPAERDDD